MRPLLTILILLALIGCDQRKASSQKAYESEPKDTIIPSNAISTKYLITANAVGYFKIGKPWQSTATKEYGYDYIQGYGICVDACCDGGYVLGLKRDDAGEFIEDGLLTIGCAEYDDDESETKHHSNPNVFYATSDNCKAWYWKDKISYIFLYSDLYKTKEGIGVGTTLEEIQQKFGKLQFHIGWIEENPNAMQVRIPAYPTIQFILDAEDYKGDWEQISLVRDKNELTIADFNDGTKIDRILVDNRKDKSED